MYGYKYGSVDYNKDITDIRGMIFTSVRQNGDFILFENDEWLVEIGHHQDCCEDVYIESLVGDLYDLINTPILVADERTCNYDPPNGRNPVSYSWTFYCFASVKGYVDIRWFGSSNGYYGERANVYFYRKE